VIQALRGGAIPEPLYAFSNVGEFGPPSTGSPDAAALASPVLYCLRWSDEVFWTVRIYALDREINGAFILREEALQRAMLSAQAARAHSVLVLENGLPVVVSGALLEELDMEVLCSVPGPSTPR
jgi:hypothetical protein